MENEMQSISCPASALSEAAYTSTTLQDILQTVELISLQDQQSMLP